MDIIIQTLMDQYPFVLKILVILGACRAVFKPLSIAAQAYVDASESAQDNEFYEKIKNNKIFKAIEFILDYSVSVKLPKK